MTLKVFISYATEDYEKARQIYKDLKAAGVTPWFDREDLLPGQNWQHEIKKAIRESDYCLVLLSSHAFSRRGFVHAEQKYALEILKEHPDGGSFVVPARLDNCEMPMSLHDIHWVDLFPTREPGMRQLLRLFAPESAGETESEPEEMGEPSHIPFFDALFEQFHRNRVVMLTGQAGRDSVPMSPTLKEYAQHFYGPGNFIHIVPPVAADRGDFFSDLERQCGATTQLGSDVGFMQAVESHLTGNNPVLLFVTGFERSTEERLKDLAGALRSMDERRGELLRILISGGEKLVKLYYNRGELSYLSSSQITEWPELTAADVCAVCENSCANPATARRILEITGGNPLLLEMAIRHCAANGGFDEANCVEMLKDAPASARLFAQFDTDGPTREMVCRLLKEDEPGPYKHYMRDGVLRHLYWENLLKKSGDGKRLVWRCGLLVEIGKEVLECT